MEAINRRKTFCETRVQQPHGQISRESSEGHDGPFALRVMPNLRGIFLHIVKKLSVKVIGHRQHCKQL